MWDGLNVELKFVIMSYWDALSAVMSNTSDICSTIRSLMSPRLLLPCCPCRECRADREEEEEGRCAGRLRLWPPSSSAQCGLLCQSVRWEKGRQSYLATNMADTRTANISKLVLKQAGRAKEKVSKTPQPLSWCPARSPVTVCALWSVWDLDWETLWCDDHHAPVEPREGSVDTCELCFGLTITAQMVLTSQSQGQSALLSSVKKTSNIVRQTVLLYNSSQTSRAS